MTAYDTTDDDLDLGHDLSDVEDREVFALLPKGEYQVQAVNVHLAQSSTGNQVIKAQFQVLGGEHDNRRIFENYSIQHHNPQAVEIALRGLKSWCIACGRSGNERLTMGLLKALEGAEFLATVYVQQDKTGQYEPQNRIRTYKPLPGSAPIPPATKAEAAAYRAASGASAKPAAQASAAKPAAGKRPWEKSAA